MKIDFSKVVTVEMIDTRRKGELKQTVATRRYNEETKGIVVNGIAINSERDSQALITGATLSAMLDPDYVCRWKTTDGFIELNAHLLKDISLKMRNHVQSCFDLEQTLVEAIDAGTYTDNLLDEGWPNGIYNDA